MKLYELSQNYNNLYELIENEDIPIEAVEEGLKEIEDSIESKFENTAKLIKSFEGAVKVFKEEEKRLNNRRTVMENKVKSIKAYLLNQLDYMERTKVNANTFVVRKQKSPKGLAILDQSKLDAKYLIPQESKVDTDQIKKDLKEGKEVEGAAYKPDSYHIRIQ